MKLIRVMGWAIDPSEVTYVSLVSKGPGAGQETFSVGLKNDRCVILNDNQVTNFDTIREQFIKDVNAS